MRQRKNCINGMAVARWSFLFRADHGIVERDRFSIFKRNYQRKKNKITCRLSQSTVIANAAGKQ